MRLLRACSVPVALQEHAPARLVDPVVVGAGHDLDPPDPVVGDRRAAIRAHPPARRADAGACGGAEGQALAGLQRMAFHAADAGHVEGRARAQHRRRLDAAGDRQTGAGAHTRETGLQHRAGGHGDALPLRHGRAVQPGRHRSPGERDHAVLLEAERGPEELDLQPRGVACVADQQIGEAEGPHVEGAGRRETLLPEAVAAGKILHGGLQTGLDHLDHGRRPYGSRARAQAPPPHPGPLRPQGRRGRVGWCNHLPPSRPPFGGRGTGGGGARAAASEAAAARRLTFMSRVASQAW